MDWGHLMLHPLKPEDGLTAEAARHGWGDDAEEGLFVGVGNGFRKASSVPVLRNESVKECNTIRESPVLVGASRTSAVDTALKSRGRPGTRYRPFTAITLPCTNEGTI